MTYKYRYVPGLLILELARPGFRPTWVPAMGMALGRPAPKRAPLISSFSKCAFKNAKILFLSQRMLPSRIPEDTLPQNSRFSYRNVQLWSETTGSKTSAIQVTSNDLILIRLAALGHSIKLAIGLQILGNRL